MVDALLIQIYTSYLHFSEPKKEPQLGQYYIAEYAHRRGYNIRIKRYASMEPLVSNILQLTDEHKCCLLGFYVDCNNEWVLRRILFDIKGRNPDIFVIIGGPQVTGDPYLALKRIPSADVAIVGEGEIPFSEILSCDYREQKNLYAIKSLVFKRNNGDFYFTGSQKQECLDKYPFPRRKDYSLDQDLVFDQISTGRGCVGNCAFCFEGSKKDNLLRLRPIADVLEEIDYIIDNLANQKYICFLDDTFIINPSRTKAICEHLISKYHGEYKWFCEARVDILSKNMELLPLLKEAGMFRVQLGGESGSQKVLDAYRKHMNVCDLKNMVKSLYEIGIPSIYINFIIGGAFETIETFNETLELAKCLMEIAPGCAEVGSSIFTPYVGTPMYLNPEKYGIKIVDNNILSGADGYMSFTETEELSRYKILQLYYLFEGECSKKAEEIVKKLSYVTISNIFKWYNEYGLETTWTKKLQQNEAIDKYFAAIYKHGFVSIRELTIETIQLFVPHRTKEPISDGTKLYRSTYAGDYIANSLLEEQVFLLSSGKIPFAEIVYIISKNHSFNTNDDLEKRIFDMYCQFDNEFLIVWKRDL
jgi:radical SAM superfamily enzyme YgiQ (UPF0313 family)